MEDEKVTITEPELWVQIDRKTGQPIGEVKEVDVVQKPVERSGFMITYLATIIQMIDKLGNQRMRVVKYILKNMDKSSNTLIKTVREISRESGISKQTVIDTLKILEEYNIITRKTGSLMISPKLIHRGDAKKERYLLAKFKAIQNSDNRKSKTADDLPEKIIPFGL